MPKPVQKLNPRVRGMRCLRCRTVFPVADYFTGCPSCSRQYMPVNLAVEYRDLPTRIDSVAEWEVYRGHPTLGEGTTPLVALEMLAEEVGVAALHLKNEGANPTGSHKDRMSRFIVQRALEIGASTVAAASSGNAGVSLAAYAAHAGLDCVIVTTPDMNPSWRRGIEMCGATLFAAETPEQRWHVLARHARAGDWYPATNFVVPAVGSNPFGVDGFRSIALELFVQLGGNPPTDILVPTARADLLWGIARGFRDLRDVGLLRQPPRVHAVEPFGRISRVLAGDDYRGSFPGGTSMTSIGGTTVTYQALDALTSCGGTAVVADDDVAQSDQMRLAQCGFYLELSSAAALTGLRRLISRGVVGRQATVVLIGTSSGFSEYQDFSDPIALVDPRSG